MGVDLHSVLSLISHVLSVLPECFPSVLFNLVLWTLALIGREVKSWGGERMRRVGELGQTIRDKHLDGQCFLK